MRSPRALALIAATSLALWMLLWLRLGGTPPTVSKTGIVAAHDLAVQAVKQLLNVDVSRWQWRPENSYSHPLHLWQARHGSQPFDTFDSPLHVRLIFNDPASRRQITVSVGGHGRVTRIYTPKPGRRAKDLELTFPNRMEMAERAFLLLAGPDASRFAPLADNADRMEPRWTAEAPSKPALEWQIAVRFDGNNFREASVSHRIADPVGKQLEAVSRAFSATSKISLGILIFFASFFLFASYLIRWMRGHIHHRSALTAGALMIGTGIIGTAPNFLMFRGTHGSFQTGVIVGVGWLALCATAIIGVGLEAARRNEWEKWREMRLILQRRWRAEAIPQSILRGFAWSGVLGLPPLVIAASGLFPDTLLQWESVWDHMLSAAPVTMVIFTPFELTSVALFAGLLPVLTRTLTVRSIGIMVFFATACATSFLFTPFGSGLPGAVLSTVLTVAIQLFLYQQYGLLTLLAAAKMHSILVAVAILSSSASPNFSKSGILLGVASLVYAGLFVMLKRIARAGEPSDEDILTGKLSQKERLKVEFSLAQQAQKRMLPESAPSVSGFSLAGSCEPARDVGGDLYDYFRFSDGRLGICVADVSGKGMPAALYMTLTKGVIAAAAPEASDVAALAMHLNRHLHQACRRKMFVTAVLGSLDPQSRTWQFVRAGHNPLLLFERSTGQARYLSPAGLGLGMTSAKIFDRSIRLEEVRIQPGDALILYSDGLTEAMNEKQELYGEDRLKTIVERSINGSAAHLLDQIRADVAAFTGAEPAHDDMTIVVLQAGSEAS